MSYKVDKTLVVLSKWKHMIIYIYMKLKFCINKKKNNKWRNFLLTKIQNKILSYAYLSEFENSYDQ